MEREAVVTPVEAEKVIALLLGADGECYHCAAKLIKAFALDFPRYSALAFKRYEERFGSDPVAALLS